MPVAGDFYFGQSKIIVISWPFCGLLHSIVAFELWCWRRLLRVPWTARRSVLNIHWKDWCWSWNSNTLPTWQKELSHWERPWCWERLKVGEGDNRGWDGWMASLTWWTWVWASSEGWWWTGRPGVLQSMGSQRVRHNWATDEGLQYNFLVNSMEHFLKADTVSPVHCCHEVYGLREEKNVLSSFTKCFMVSKEFPHSSSH